MLLGFWGPGTQGLRMRFIDCRLQGLGLVLRLRDLGFRLRLPQDRDHRKDDGQVRVEWIRPTLLGGSEGLSEE